MFLTRKCVFAFLVLIGLLFSGANPLRAAAGDNDWQLVTPAELALKEPVVEKDADAEAIFWEVRVDDSSAEELAMNHYIRVKIFTERGREKYSKIDVPFVKGMKVKNLLARVIKADGTIVELKKEDVFEREIVKASGVKVKAKSFAVPSIEPGVIVEYRYREVIPNGIANNMRLVFQRDIPIRNVSYYVKPAGVGGSFEIPDIQHERHKFSKRQKRLLPRDDDKRGEPARRTADAARRRSAFVDADLLHV